MNLAIIYASRAGATSEIANRIAEGVKGKISAGEGNTIEVIPVKQAGDPSKYDAVVLGAGIRAGSIPGPMKRYASRYEEQLLAKPLFLYVSSISTGENAQSYIESNFSNRLNAHAGARCAAGGRIKMSELKPFPRFLLKKIANVDQDMEDFDSTAIEALIDSIAERAVPGDDN